AGGRAPPRRPARPRGRGGEAPQRRGHPAPRAGAHRGGVGRAAAGNPRGRPAVQHALRDIPMTRPTLLSAVALIGALGCGSGGGGTPADAGPPDGYVAGSPVTVAVGDVFPAGTVVRDQYGGGPPAARPDRGGASHPPPPR